MFITFTGTQKLAVERSVAEVFGVVSEASKVKTLLLLSGGSAAKIYTRLVGMASYFPSDLSRLSVGLVDERWGNVGHADSNARLVEETGLIDALVIRGAKWWPVLTPTNEKKLTLQETGDWYEKLLVDDLGLTSKSTKVVAVVGVGKDGHIFGVSPIKSLSKFENTFPKEKLFVGYKASFTEKKERLTLTLQAAEYFDYAYGVALGKEKRKIMSQLASEKDPKKELLHKFPAGVLRGVRGAVFTDAY